MQATPILIEGAEATEAKEAKEAKATGPVELEDSDDEMEACHCIPLHPIASHCIPLHPIAMCLAYLAWFSDKSSVES